jgi:hypothetical protein
LINERLAMTGPQDVHTQLRAATTSKKALNDFALELSFEFVHATP